MATPSPVKLYHPSRPSERVAVVSAAPASAAGQLVVQVAKGKKRTALTDSKMFGPFSEAEIALAFQSIVDGLYAEGYVGAGLGGVLLALDEKNPKTRALAALRLGWRKETRFVESLLRLTEKPKEDISSVTDALGLIGDKKALPAVTAEAERKLLSRRRSGVEALFHVDAKEGEAARAAAMQRALERLPVSLHKLVEAVGDDPHAQSVQAVHAALVALPIKERGVALDAVYELALARAGLAEAVRQALRDVDVAEPHVWRYAKSVWKRAMLRRDYPTWSLVQYRTEIRGRSAKGTSANLKSGYDGEVKKTRVFGKSTVNYVRRRGWRYLKTIASYHANEYALAAAWAVVHYTDSDDVVDFKKKGPPTGRSYLLHRVLFGASSRYRYDGRNATFKMVGDKKAVTWKEIQQEKNKPAAPSTGREEAFADLWDQSPRAFVLLLGRSRHSAVQKFAYEAVTQRIKNALQDASHEDVALLMSSDDPKIVDLGLTELRRRFDPQKPDLDLVYSLCASPSDVVRNHGVLWLADCAAVWTRDFAATVRFLGLKTAQGREAAARLWNGAASSLPAELRAKLADELLRKVEGKEPDEGAFSGFAEALRTGLIAEAVALCTLDRALALVDKESESAISVGAAILSRLQGAMSALGLPRVLGMATHDKAAVRRAAMALLQGAVPQLQKDPSVLFGLAESDWDDVRSEALKLLDHVDVAALGLDGLMGLADSTRIDVQKKAQGILDAALRVGPGGVDVHELLGRLGQHPYPLMRKYAVSLAVEHLKPGFVRLAKLELLFRSVLFDTWPDRKLKRTVIDFLAERGQQDENQAGVAAQILGDFVRTRCVDDRERALLALTKIQLAFPFVESPMKIVAAPAASAASPGAEAKSS